ncbi:MAG: glycine cleavage system protein GcvH [Candidatus Eisenbacteria bacterium]|nr:glycine cleavage system protein GcvH [Candidatus Eisenbacteria bacterium]
MSTIRQELKYTKEHEWARLEGGEWVVGLTDYAQGELGDVVFVELPKVGAEVVAGATFGTVEAVKTVSDMYAPVSGTITAVNEALGADPGVVNRDAYGDGWFVKIRPSGPDQGKDLLEAKAYAALIGQSL